MKSLLRLRNILIGLTITLIAGAGYLLSSDKYTEAKLRTMQDEIPPTEQVDLRGLREIQASGGPIINFSELKQKLDLYKKVIIVDAMREDHGYIKDRPTTFFGYNKHDPDIRYPLRRLLYTGTIKVRKDLVIPEKEMAAKWGFDYKNINIDSKVLTIDKSVDEFVAFFDQLPNDVWVHFHCRLGKGRTSMMLVMLDTMRNAPQVALKDIVKRQFLLGSENLFNTAARRSGTYTSTTLENRKKFIEKFYDFICQRKAGGIQQWSIWNLKEAEKNHTSVDFGANPSFHEKL